MMLLVGQQEGHPAKEKWLKEIPVVFLRELP